MSDEATLVMWPVPDDLDHDAECKYTGRVRTVPDASGEDAEHVFWTGRGMYCARARGHAGPHYDEDDRVYWEGGMDQGEGEEDEEDEDDD